MSTIEQTQTTIQVYQVFIKATPEAIWEAITKPEFTRQFFHGVEIDATADRRLAKMGDMPAEEDPVFEYDPPRRLSHGWQSKWSDELAAEEPSRVTWEIEPRDDGITLLTLVHDRLEGAPKTASAVYGQGWMFVLSGLKTLLETGKPLG
jgi:uncharacterized protein YndB with AHSA1/START domain